MTRALATGRPTPARTRLFSSWFAEHTQTRRPAAAGRAARPIQ